MASNKVSALSAQTSAGDDDLLYLADTADGGSTYASKKITKANLFSGYATAATHSTAYTALAAANEVHIDNLVTTTGLAKDSTTLGTFTGSTISDNDSIKDALQDLETAVESAAAGSAIADRTKTETDATNATRYVTFVGDDNAHATAETVYTDAGVTYNPSTNTMTVGNLTVSGTTTTVDTVTMQAANAVVFEGATADDNESTLTVVDPTADRTIKLPNQSGCLPVLAADSTTAITATPEELNILDGVTSTAAELNLLDGLTCSTAEIEKLCGMTASTDELNLLDGVTATTAELNILDGVTSTAAELNILDGVTSTAAELNILDGVTSTAAELNLLDGVTATTTELNYVDGVTSAIQTQINTKCATGANVNTLVASTTSQTVPATYYFLVVDQSDGSIKVINKTFLEDEG